MHILIVEDEHKLAEILRNGLEEHGFAVDIAYDGEEGLARAELEVYDLVVLDVMLPKLDGLAVCRQLRASRRNMPVLMLTARDTVDNRVDGLNSGADDYLIPVLRVADIEVDTITHEVRRAGKHIDLTNKEYAILEYFLRNPNRVLTRAQITEHVWPHEFVAMSNVVDVYVRYLRRKLGDEQEPQLLRTVRGTGYRLEEPMS